MNLARLSALLALFVFWTCRPPTGLAKDKDKESDSSNEDVSIAKITLVRDAGEKFEPVETFKPSDIFGVLVQLNDVKPGTKVKAIWIAVDAGGMKNKKIFEKEVEFTEQALKEAKIKDRVDFTLSHDDPYPTGEYKADIYLNGVLADTAQFTIEE